MRLPDRALLAALLVAAALLRFGALDREDIWLDEGYSVRLATASFGEIARFLSVDNKPPLYYFSLHLWTRVVGDSVTAIRSFSAAAGLAAVAVVWLIGAPLVSRRTARVAALLLAVHPLAVHYSREGRNYSLVILFSLASILALSWAIETNERRRWLAFGLSFSIALMLHYIAALLLPVFALQLVTAKNRAVAWSRCAVSTTAAFLPLLAWLPWARKQDSIASTLSWFEPFWAAWSPLEPFALSLTMFLPGGAAPPWVGLPSLGALQPLVVLSGLAAIACVLFHLESDVTTGQRLVILGAVLIPLVLLWAESMASVPLYIVGRADIVAFPGAVLLVATAIVRARTRLAGAFVAGLVFASAAAGLAAYFRAEPINPESPVLRPLAASLAAGDLVVCSGLTRPTLEYEVQQARVSDVRIVSYPELMAGNPAIFDPRPWTTDYLEAEAEAVDDLLRETKRRGGRAYLLLPGGESSVPLALMLSSSWATRSVGSYRLKRVGSLVDVVEAVSRRNP